MSKNSELILVTGASGFVALHVINKFIKEGYKVRGTVRSLKDESKLAPIRRLGTKDNLELVEADLLNENSWAAAMKDVTRVIHVASPFPMVSPTDENQLIKPAVEGTRNVLTAAFKANVQRVVVTSSTAAIIDFYEENQKNYKEYSEKDWPNADKIPTAYLKSKTFAEKCAWDFVAEKKKNNQKCFGLSVINPSLILGPSLHGVEGVLGTSESMILGLVNGSVTKISGFSIVMCDVRDVAEAHFKAAFLESAVDKRFAIVSEREFVSMKTIAEYLRSEFEPKGYKIPTEAEPGTQSKSTVNNSRLINDLKINPTPLKKTVIDMVQSFIDHGVIKKP